jgi:hypothetical protein
MRDRQALASLALALVDGSIRFGEAADEMFVDTFKSLEEVALAHAYLAGAFALLDGSRSAPADHVFVDDLVVPYGRRGDQAGVCLLRPR